VRRSSDRLLLIDNYPEPRGIADALVKRLPATGYVECGSIGLKACRVADGTADLFVKDVVIRDWDIAPADLILQEAGGCITNVDGHDLRYDGASKIHGVIAAVNNTIASNALRLLAAPNEVPMSL